MPRGGDVACLIHVTIPPNRAAMRDSQGGPRKGRVGRHQEDRERKEEEEEEEEEEKLYLPLEARKRVQTSKAKSQRRRASAT